MRAYLEGEGKSQDLKSGSDSDGKPMLFGTTERIRHAQRCEGGYREAGCLLKNPSHDTGGWSGALFWVHFRLVERQVDLKMAGCRMLAEVSSHREHMMYP